LLTSSVQRRSVARARTPDVPVDPQVEQAHEQTSGSSAGTDSEPTSLIGAVAKLVVQHRTSSVDQQSGPAGARSDGGAVRPALGAPERAWREQAL
jgi:hypothetical protein